jgi:Tol biopolymer transport system component
MNSYLKRNKSFAEFALSIWAALSIGLSLAACGLFAEPGYIAYTLGEEGSRAIAVSMPDGTDQRIITVDPDGSNSDNFAPVWSPDRQHLAFISNRDGNHEIYLAIADGSNFMRLTNTGVDESQISWSPKGDRIVYTSQSDNGLPQVHWLNLSNLRPNRLLFGSDSEIDPSWSPSGELIAFSVLDNNGNSTGIFLRNPDGVNRIQISQSNDRDPVWSPDSKQLAFVSTRDGSEDIYVVEIGENGPLGQALRITNTPGRDFAPVWSKNGQRIAFLSDRNGNVDIFTVSPNGEDLETLTRSPVDETSVEWSNDERLVFESITSGLSQLFVMNPDGVQKQITEGSIPSSLPQW